MTLLSELKGWDGKSADYLNSVYDRYSRQPDFLEMLIVWMNDPSLQSGSTWLLKHHFDCDGEPLEQELTIQLYKNLPALEQWDARLHILQIMQHVPAPGRQANAIKIFLNRCLQDENKFVRAWAYSGFWELAQQHSRFRHEVESLLHDGLEKESAASIKARIRKCLKRGF